MLEIVLEQWVVYENPRDYPGKFVVRRFGITQGGGLVKDLEPSYVGPTLEGARAVIPPDCVCLSRCGEDDPVIVETWV